MLFNGINPKDAKIEVFFVERAEQLLKEGGIAAIILPQSILSGEKYNTLRTFIKSHFRILSMLLTADITFLGTTTSPVILFLKKEKVQSSDYDILVHQSPKYSNPKTSKLRNLETQFLGYEFSSNKNKSGISPKPNSILEKLIPATKEFVCSGNVRHFTLNPKYSKIVKLSDITINETIGYSGDIYPKRIVCTGNPLNKYCQINQREESDFIHLPTSYIEIGDLKTQVPTKVIKSSRLCKKGDILISSLLPEKEKIVIAKGEFMLSSAIYVLSGFKNDTERDMVFHKLQTPAVIDQMCALVDGFKITYAKISEHNLYNNVLI